MDRRTFSKIAALASTTLVAGKSLLALNQESVEESKHEEIYQFKIGDFECFCINDGGKDYPPERFFKNVPKEKIENILKERNLPIDVIYTPYTHLVVNTGKNLVLVDTGAGDLIPGNGKLAPSMSSAGIEPTDIDTVFITHAHPDHIGGLLDEKGKPIYSNARYCIWKDEWDFWFSESANELAKESHVKSAREKLGPVKDRMDYVEKECEFLPGIHVIAAPGHTPGHVVISFSSGGEQLYYVADTVLYPLHLEHPDWLSVYDILPEKAELSKKKIFDLVAEKNVLVIAQHFVPFPSLGTVVKKGNGWLWRPVETKG
ncbi:MBL fold metallo-hydrolase [candidate division KSB1 bacterium]|nr:MBL fold metallo-hydrolase [candidate division KSB1 bacterium]